MKRYRFSLRLFTLPLFAVVFFLATGSGQAQTVSIEVGMFSAPDESIPWLKKEIEAFRQQYPNIDVQVKGLEAPVRRRFQTHDDYFGANPESVLAANVTGLDSQFVYIAPYLAERGLIEPIEKFDTPTDSFSLSAFPAPLLKTVKFQGATWGVPWLSRDPVLVLDWELFENAGIYEPPRTWQEFIDVASALTRDTDGDGTIDQWGLGYRTTDDAIPCMFLSMVIQQGDGIMHEGLFEGGDQAIADAVRFMSNLNGSWRMAKDDGRSLPTRLADTRVRYAMHLEMTHTLGAATDDPRLRLAPMPSLDGQPKSFAAHRRYFAIRPSSPAKEAASWEFVKWMTRQDISIPNEFAGFPVRNDFTSRPDFQAMMAGKIQHPELIFDSSQHSVLALDRVYDLTPAVERYWQVLVPAFSDPSKTAISLERARDAANRYLGEYWYPYQ